MNILFFKNDSGDDAYPICIIDRSLSEIQIKDIVKMSIGDDYLVSNDEICGDYVSNDKICGDYYIQSFGHVPKATDLLIKKINEDGKE